MQAYRSFNRLQTIAVMVCPLSGFVVCNSLYQQEIIIMPFGAFINNIPPAIFLLVHLVGFAAGAFFAYRSFEAGASLLGWGFALYALAELCYMTYHLDWTVFLFAHTISEVLDLVRLCPDLQRRLPDDPRHAPHRACEGLR